MNFLFKNIFSKVLVCLLAALIPFTLIVCAYQIRKYTDLSREVSALEEKQDLLIDDNKKLVSDISLLSSSDRIEKIATEELGMHKAQTEDIVRVEMNGAKR